MVANLKKPPICMRCKKKNVFTAGSFKQDAKIISWHYRCKCGWSKKWGKYPTVNWKAIISEN